MPNRRVLVAHPDESVREQLVERLSGLDVVTVAGADQLVSTADDTFDGLIIACCFGREDADGLDLATSFRCGRLGSFRGFVLGIACNEQCTRDFDSRRITSGDAVFVGRVMVLEMIQLGPKVQAQDVAV